MMTFLTGVVIPAARLQAAYTKLTLVVEPIDPTLTAHVDAQLLQSALMNVLNNAFKYTRHDGRVTLRAREHAGRVPDIGPWKMFSLSPDHYKVAVAIAAGCAARRAAPVRRLWRLRLRCDRGLGERARRRRARG